MGEERTPVVWHFPIYKDPVNPRIGVAREIEARGYLSGLDRRITLLRNEALVLRRRQSTKKAKARLMEAHQLQTELREYLCDSGMDNRTITHH